MIEFEWLYAKCKDLVRNGLFDEALDLMNAAIKSQQLQFSSEHKLKLILLKGHTYRNMRDHIQAIYQYRQAYSIKESDIILMFIAQCYWLMEDHKKAATEIDKVTIPGLVETYEYWKQHIAEREGR